MYMGHRDEYISEVDLHESFVLYRQNIYKTHVNLK